MLLQRLSVTANGNITAHSDTVMGDWTFQYDTLNRLLLAAPADNAPSSYIHAVACFGYDGFGNRTKATFDTTSSDCSATAGTTTARYNAANEVTFVGQSPPISYSAASGFVYDAASNVYQDAANTYAYDAEGRRCGFKPTTGGAQYQYLYDAEGLRVGQATITGTFPAKNTTCAAPGAAAGFVLKKQYLLDLGGNQVTELNGTGSGSIRMYLPERILRRLIVRLPLAFSSTSRTRWARGASRPAAQEL